MNVQPLLDRCARAERDLAAERAPMHNLFERKLTQLFEPGLWIDMRPDRIVGLERDLRAVLFGMHADYPGKRTTRFQAVGTPIVLLAPDPSRCLWDAPVRTPGGVAGHLRGTALDNLAIEFLGGRGKPYVETLSHWLDESLA